MVRIEGLRRACGAKFFRATVDREAEEIARRILARVEASTAFSRDRDHCRNPELYLPALRAALERFGNSLAILIPGRAPTSIPCAVSAGRITALLSGWDHAKTLAALALFGDSPASIASISPFASNCLEAGSMVER